MYIFIFTVKIFTAVKYIFYIFTGVLSEYNINVRISLFPEFIYVISFVFIFFDV